MKILTTRSLKLRNFFNHHLCVSFDTPALISSPYLVKISFKIAINTPINHPNSTASNFPYQTFLLQRLNSSMATDFPCLSREDLRPGRPSRLYVLFLS